MARAISLAVYASITAVIGRRVLASIDSAVASDAGDPVLNAAILAWNAVNVPWSDDWFHFPIFHPTPNALVFSEHLLGGSLMATPVYWLTGNALTAYNVTLLLSYPLCGAAMYALVWRLTASAPAAFLAGLAYAFAPYRASQLPHIQVLLSWWAPLALLGLHGFAEPPAPAAPRRRHRSAAEPALHDRNPQPGEGPSGAEGQPIDATSGEQILTHRPPPRTHRFWWLLLFAVSWLLQGASNGYFLVFFTVLVGLWVLWFLVARRRWRDAAWVAAAGLVAALPLAPILYRYLVAQYELGLQRSLGEMASFSADIAAPLCAPPSLTFWGWLRVACGAEGELFIGAALAGLCVAGALVLHDPPKRRDAEISHGRTPRVRIAAVRIAIAGAALYLVIAFSVVAIGSWRIDLGWLRASASSADKPLTVAFVLLLIALFFSRWFQHTVRRGSTATFYLLAAVACWIFSWGPFPRLFGVEVLYQAPFAWLLQLPGVGGLRVPARFWMMTVLCLVVLMGLGVARLLHRRSRRTAAIFVGAAACLLLADGWMTISTAPVPDVAPNAAALRGATVAVLPIGDRSRDVAVVYHAVTGGWRSVNGFSGYEPVYYEALRTLSQDGDPMQLEPFLARGDLHVIDHSAGMREYRMPARPLGRDVVSGQRRTIRSAEASCSPENVGLVSDGAVATSWVCGTQMADHQFTADLGETGQVGAIVHALGLNGAFFPRQLVIETSLDGATWTEAWSGSPAAAVLRAALSAPRDTRAVIRFPPRAARYVRLRQTGRHEINFWSIAELEVWSGGG